jgi:AcrR family transcriptional regulator
MRDQPAPRTHRSRKSGNEGGQTAGRVSGAKTGDAVPASQPDTREMLKRTASRLFAERGIDGVAVRDIVAASGQRNAASIHYYFSTKEALIRELVVDGAKAIDTRYHECLDELERRGGEVSTRDVVQAMVRAVISAQPESGEGSYLRFMAGLQLNHRKLVMDAVGKQWRSGYQRVLSQLRGLLSQHPAEIVNQRFVFMTLLLQAAMANWEAAAADPSRGRSAWRTEFAIENLVDTIDAMLLAPSSAATVASRPGARPKTA